MGDARRVKRLALSGTTACHGAVAVLLLGNLGLTNLFTVEAIIPGTSPPDASQMPCSVSQFLIPNIPNEKSSM